MAVPCTLIDAITIDQSVPRPIILLIPQYIIILISTVKIDHIMGQPIIEAKFENTLKFLIKFKINA